MDLQCEVKENIHMRRIRVISVLCLGSAMTWAQDETTLRSAMKQIGPTCYGVHREKAADGSWNVSSHDHMDLD